MSLWEKVKNILVIPDDDFEDDFEDEVQPAPKEEPKKTAVYENTYTKRSEPTPRIIGGKGRNAQLSSQMQVVLVKPERYDEVTSIADHLNEKKTVVLNLETTERDLARRIVDFLSGATYANHGNIRKVSRGTFLIVPSGVDMMGEPSIEELEDGSMYY